jgi:hypothetical protein
MGENVRFGRHVETRAADLARTDASNAFEARLVNVEAWIPHLQAGMITADIRRAIGETIGEVVQGAVDEMREHVGKALRKAVAAVQEQFQAELALAVDDLTTKIDAKLWPTPAGEDPGVIRQVVADLRAATVRNKDQLGARLDALSDRFGERVDRLSQRIDAVEQRRDAQRLFATLSQLQARSRKRLEQRIAALEGKVAALDKDLVEEGVLGREVPGAPPALSPPISQGGGRISEESAIRSDGAGPSPLANSMNLRLSHV